MKIFVGDRVKFETNSDGYPRWNEFYDQGNCGTFCKGIVTSVGSVHCTVRHNNPKNHSVIIYSWRLDGIDTGRKGFLEILPRKKLKAKKIFYVEVSEAIDFPGRHFPAGFVSKACMDPHLDDHMTVRLLDVNPDPSLGVLSCPDISLLEVNEISKSAYYRRYQKIGKKVNA